ncbi:hypothetical protein LIER_18444 [Lithospermum erythrorhizon]|uniref:RING-type E3 ubiquitin transferase n=1 Tax=Lithospermum erythrorhizon TaxID=34254 RepID=A0AAV3QGN2_LITER
MRLQENQIEGTYHNDEESFEDPTDVVSEEDDEESSEDSADGENDEDDEESSEDSADGENDEDDEESSEDSADDDENDEDDEESSEDPADDENDEDDEESSEDLTDDDESDQENSTDDDEYDYWLPEFDEIGDMMIPTSESSIKSLVMRKMKRGEIDEEEEGSSCPICLEEFLEGSVTGCMPCSHMFHEECVTNWLRKSHYCPALRCQQQCPIRVAT